MLDNANHGPFTIVTSIYVYSQIAIGFLNRRNEYTNCNLQLNVYMYM